MEYIKIDKTSFHAFTPKTKKFFRLDEKGMFEITLKENKNSISESGEKLTEAKLKSCHKINYMTDKKEYLFVLSENNIDNKLKGTRNEIASKIKAEVSIFNDGSLLPLVSSVTQYLEKKNQIKQIDVNLPSGIGFYLNSDDEEELIYDFEIKDKINYTDEVSKEEVRKELDKINDFFNFYYSEESSKSFIKSIFANGLYSCLSYIRKQKGLQTPNIIIEGSSNTGKTAGVNIFLYVLGINKKTKLYEDCFMNGSDFRKANFDILGETTMPLILDEGQDLLDSLSGESLTKEDKQKSELLKSAVDGNTQVPIRKIMTDTSKRTYKNIYCNRSIFIISNFTTLDLSSEAWKKRTIIYLTKKEHRKSIEKSSKLSIYFDKIEESYKISSYIYNELKKMSFEEMKNLGFFESSFIKSSQNFFDYFMDQVDYQKFKDVFYYKPEELKSTIDYQLNDVKEFIMSSLEYQSRNVDRSLLDDVKEWFYNIFTKDSYDDLSQLKQDIVKRLKIVTETSRLSYLNILKSKDKAYILKNNFLREYKRYANKLNRSNLEAGDFEKIFEAIGGKVNDKISYKKRINSDKVKTFCKSGVEISVTNLFEFLTKSIFNYDIDEKGIVSKNSEVIKVKKKNTNNKSEIIKRLKNILSKRDIVHIDVLLEKIKVKENKLWDVIDFLKKKGVLFEPKPGKFTLVE